MAFRVEMQVRIGWVGDGMSGAGLAQQQANIPGVASGLLAGIAFNAQVIKLIQAEGVTAVSADAPTATEFKTAVSLAATDLNSQITAAIVTQMQNWASGQP